MLKYLRAGNGTLLIYMTDEDFRLFSAYHLLHCEKRELLGSSAHLLYICRKL